MDTSYKQYIHATVYQLYKHTSYSLPLHLYRSVGYSKIPSGVAHALKIIVAVNACIWIWICAIIPKQSLLPGQTENFGNSLVHFASNYSSQEIWLNQFSQYSELSPSSEIPAFCLHHYSVHYVQRCNKTTHNKTDISHLKTSQVFSHKSANWMLHSAIGLS